jgi:hypothetical protein
VKGEFRSGVGPLYAAKGTARAPARAQESFARILDRRGVSPAPRHGRGAEATTSRGSSGRTHALRQRVPCRVVASAGFPGEPTGAGEKPYPCAAGLALSDRAAPLGGSALRVRPGDPPLTVLAGRRLVVAHLTPPFAWKRKRQAAARGRGPCPRRAQPLVEVLRAPHTLRDGQCDGQKRPQRPIWRPYTGKWRRDGAACRRGRRAPSCRSFRPRSGDGIEPSKRRAAPPCRF